MTTVYESDVFELGVFGITPPLTVSAHDLLPKNSTRLERDMVRSSNHLQRIGSVSRMRDAKYVNIPDDVVPWLIYEYNLGAVSKYIDDLRQVLELGIPWQRIRGTPASILEALSWIGYTPFIDEAEEAGTSWWSDYHLGFTDAVAAGDLLAVAGLAGLSNPARGRTQRLFSIHYDFRRLVYSWDEGWSSGRRWCDHSGIRGLDGMERVQVSLSYLDTGSGDGGILHGVDSSYGPSGFIEPFIWRWSSTGVWSGQWHDLMPGGGASLVDSGFVNVYSPSSATWLDATWPDSTWNEATSDQISGAEVFASP